MEAVEAKLSADGGVAAAVSVGGVKTDSQMSSDS